MTKTTINVTTKAIVINNGKKTLEIPCVNDNSKGIKWYVTKASDGKDFVAIGFKRYANNEMRANLYLHDYKGIFGNLKALDGTTLDRLDRKALGDKGFKYTVTGLSSLENFAGLFFDFEASRLEYNKALEKPATKPAKPATKAKAKAPAKPATKPTKATAKAPATKATAPATKPATAPATA